MKSKNQPKKDPVPKTIRQADAVVQRRVAAVLETAAAYESHTLWELERELWVKLLALGRALVALFLLKAAQRPRAARYQHEGESYVLADKRTTEVGTRFGKVRFRRRVGRRVGAPRRVCDRPIDRELGLGGGFSLGVMMDIVRLCALLPFTTARDAFAEFCEWCPSPRAVLRMVDALGGRARSFLEQAPAPEGDGEVLVIQVDGKGAPAISSRERRQRARPRRATKGKSKRHQRRSRRRAQPRVRRKPRRGPARRRREAGLRRQPDHPQHHRSGQLRPMVPRHARGESDDSTHHLADRKLPGRVHLRRQRLLPHRRAGVRQRRQADRPHKGPPGAQELAPRQQIAAYAKSTRKAT